MSDEDRSGRALLPIDGWGEIGPEGKLRGDFTYRLVENLNLLNRALEHSLWTGAVLRRCKFTKVSFARSDFAGTKFIDCEFTECDFEPDELRSCFLTRVTFTRCRLVGLQCVSSQFRDCKFVDCDMSRSVIRESQFRDCLFDNVPFRRCSVTLNRYEGCNFCDVIFADATILFLIFQACEFSKCTINTETIGYTYGLSVADLDNFDFIYLGESQDRPAGHDLISALLQTYEARHWSLGACLLRLNFELYPTYLALREFARALSGDVSAEPRLDWDELLFLCMVLEHLHAAGKLPFLGVWEIEGAVQSAIERIELDQPGFTTFVPSTNNVAWRLRRLADERLKDVLAQPLEPPGGTGEMRLELTLSHRPSELLAESIPDEILIAWGVQRREIRLVAAEPGSWHEIWQLGLAALMGLNLLMAMLDTTWERAAKLWNRAKSLREASPKPAEKSVANTTLASRTDVNQDGARQDAPAQAPAPITLPSVAAAVERATADLRAVTIADREALLRLDIAIRRVSLLSDPEVQRLLAYAAPNLQVVRISSAA